MGTISSAFGIITGALEADQTALSTVANNVGNASTTGYTRETSTFTENDSIIIDGVSYGQGTTNSGPISMRDRVLMERLDQQQQMASASSTRLAALNSVQALFPPDSNSTSSSTAGDIGSDITKFFGSISALESPTAASSQRSAVLSAASTLASDISGDAASLNGQQAALDQEAANVTSQVNGLTTSIAQLNKQILAQSPSGDAGTLEDQRQEDISQLSKLVGVNQVTTENNGITIATTSGQTLVDGDTSFQLTNGAVGGVTHFFVGGTDITTGLTSGGGELGGYLTVRDVDIPSALSTLDTIAYNISTSVNTLNSSGVNANGGPGANIFSTPPAGVTGSAALMSVVMTDSSKIAAAGAGMATGDTSNAVAMAGLASTTMGTTGQKPTNYYSNFVSTLGATVSAVNIENTAQNASVTQLTSQVSTLSSVNLDDEASSMTALERSYQAGSQAFAILNTLMAQILNLGTETTVS
jgi:flagellar hook-associated protein 1 FlgK